MRPPLNPDYVVESYLRAERDLAAALEYVPYEAGHGHVWSPPFASFLLDTCSQLDSLWKAMALDSPCVSMRPRDISVTDYHKWFGRDLRTCRAAFMRGAIGWIRPFEGWTTTTDYSPLDWWTAYTSIKHDRWGNVRAATLECCVRAAAGLFIAVCNSDPCKTAVGSLLKVSAPTGISRNPIAWLARPNEKPECYVAVESSLFVYPAGWGADVSIKQTTEWQGPASIRFKAFFNGYADEP